LTCILKVDLKGGIVSIKLPIRSWFRPLGWAIFLFAEAWLFWISYRHGFARNFLDSRLGTLSALASILGVGIVTLLKKVTGRKRVIVFVTVGVFSLAAIVGKSSPSSSFNLLSEPRGPRSTNATSSDLGPGCGPYDDGKVSVVYTLGIYAFVTLEDFKALYDKNVCNIRSILASLGVSSTEHATLGKFDACDPFTNRIVLVTSPNHKIDNDDDNPFLNNWLDYGGTPLFGIDYRTSFFNNSCSGWIDLKVVIFPESGVMVDKQGLNPSFIPR
jgi:hypothetical protein